ncbi:MAG: KH domain-containing protein [Firmicutes bacterium]|nr:KH domain-containing protein [Bacillota bacterium]
MVKQTLIDIAKSIVDKPEEVAVVERQDGEYLHLELSVAPEDMGKVIGRGGKIAKAIRSVMKAAANKENIKVMVDII